MSNNPFTSDDFEKATEQGISSATKTIGKQTQAVTKSIVNQLYGQTDKTQVTDQVAQMQKTSGTVNPSQPVPQVSQQGVPQEGASLSDSSDVTKLAQTRSNLQTHLQNYFRPTIGTVEDQMNKLSEEKKKQEEMKKQQEEKDEGQRKKEVEQGKQQEVVRPQSKGRNRMGSKKTSMAVQMGKLKTETFRGSSG